MLQKSMEEIAECVVHEVSCLGSSVESLTSEDYSDRDITVSSEEIPDSTGQAEDTKESARELRNPLSVLQKNQHYDEGYRTPPYLSPGVTRKVKLSKGIFGFETDL